MWLWHHGSQRHLSKTVKISKVTNMCAYKAKIIHVRHLKHSQQAIRLLCIHFLQFIAFSRSLCWFSIGFPYVYKKQQQQKDTTKKKKQCNLPDAPATTTDSQKLDVITQQIHSEPFVIVADIQLNNANDTKRQWKSWRWEWKIRRTFSFLQQTKTLLEQHCRETHTYTTMTLSMLN